MNRRLLAGFARMAADRGLLGDAANLDFTTLPHWGDDRTLESNWCSKRGRTLVGISAALAQDPDSGLLLRADADMRRATAANWVLEFLDFSKKHGPRCATSPSTAASPPTATWPASTKPASAS